MINYGEMRKKVTFVNQKCLMKLRDLVYKGSVTIRVKGKNYRIKTPSCKALRKINQLEGNFRFVSVLSVALIASIFFQNGRRTLNCR